MTTKDMVRVTACTVAGAFTVAGTARADGIPLEMDLTTDTSELGLSSENDNAGYDVGRGILFLADEPITINGAGLYTKSADGLDATFELWMNVDTEGDSILEHATLVRSANELLFGDLGFHGTKFEGFTLTPNRFYLIRVLYDEPADENWFFDFDYRGDPPLDLGPVTVIDGVLRENVDALAAPFMSLQIVPAPGALTFLLGSMLSLRRRRR